MLGLLKSLQFSEILSISDVELSPLSPKLKHQQGNLIQNLCNNFGESGTNTQLTW